MQLHSFTTNKIVEGLLCGTTYQIFLTAFNDIGRGEPSPVIEVATEGRGEFALHVWSVTQHAAATVAPIMFQSPTGGPRSPFWPRLVSSPLANRAFSFTSPDLSTLCVACCYDVATCVLSASSPLPLQIVAAAPAAKGKVSYDSGPTQTRAETTERRQSTRDDEGRSGEAVHTKGRVPVVQPMSLQRWDILSVASAYLNEEGLYIWVSV